MSGLLTREGLSGLLRRGALAESHEAVAAAHDMLRDMGMCPTLPRMPVDAGRKARLAAAKAAAPAVGALDVLYTIPALLPGSAIREGRYLYVGEQLVATATQDDQAVLVRHALVFDGFKHVVPAGCDTGATNVAYHRDPIGRVLAAIELRQAARATSLPLPAEEVSNAA